MRSWIGLLLSLLLISSTKADIPECDYFDTVKLTDSVKFPNGSYLYENIIIPKEQTGEYDYEILVDGVKVDVPKHLRGCACKLGTCIRFCCQKNLVLVDDERACEKYTSAELKYDPFVNVTLNNGTEVRRHVLNEFIVQHDLPVPCTGHFHLDALNDETKSWKLFENGVLLRNGDNRSLSKQEYCMQPHPILTPKGESILMLVPHNCYDPAPSQLLYNILRILSIILLLITCFVYLWIPKLRTLHGYCFVCYMLCLVVAFALLTVDNLHRDWSLFGCKVNGYVGYFAVMAGFFWLTVISFDLWNSFRGNNYTVRRHTNMYRFFMYSLYAWGAAALLTIIIIIVDHSLDRDNDENLPWLPGVAMYNCWVKTNDWSAMIYFHGLMALQIIFNMTMFILTAIRIVEVKKELKSLNLPEAREKHMRSDNQTFRMFVRLFVIMGITWTFEIFAYLLQNNASWESVLKIFDYINCAQGVIIFILFVLKRSVMNLILDRIRGISSADDEDGSDEEIALQDRDGINKNIGPNILN
ncbi:G-protein coupled receptor Mth-like isoform X1 [Drosophila innubila]|uniref:G-protein coupled receptor Mth-like isoform X1 n=1 Tax=Drosophila innubila TaxID=198719 RepID=UPI00148D6B7F|nr:G-protein coupled receptor Mth-like isoform X1 [Drosophila innubila]